MGLNAQGAAKVQGDVVDLSVLIATGLKGIHAFFGETERGEEGKTVLIGSWTEYKKTFGGLLTTSDFPLLCKRALEAGCKLRIGRVLHYTDPTDKSTVTGTKAAGVIGAMDFRAKSIGAGETFKVTTTATAGMSGYFDFVIQNPAGEEVGRVTQVKTPLIEADRVRVNASNNGVELLTSSLGDAITAGTITLSGGANTGTVVAADYIGDTNAVTGIHVFDQDNDFVRISCPAIAIPAVDIALVAYVVGRQDCRAILRTPIGISGTVGIDYREGTGSYSHSPVNTWLASMIFGTLQVTHPVTSDEVSIPAIADVAAKMSGKDNNSVAWFAAAGPERGRIYNTIGVQYNLGTAARNTEFDNVDNHGLNAVIDDTDFGPVYWGNGTMQKADTLLKFENVADLVIFILRGVKPLAKSVLFNPNDVDTWKAIYRKVRPFMEQIKAGRGVWDYLYQGDQDIENISEAVVNTPADVDKGKYRFIIWIQPKVALKYVGFEITVTNSGVSFEEISGQPTV